MKSPIYFLDLKKQFASIKGEIMKSIEDALETCEFTGGKNIEEFEREFQGVSNARFNVAVNNGTSSLHLALKALNIGKDDEVIVPANTFIATAWAPIFTGAKTVFVDCTADDWQINVKKVEEKISTKTKAVIGVHLYGQPFDIDGLRTLTNQAGIPFIEDAAQAHGAKYKGSSVGGLSKIGCYSFYPTKNLGTYGEGGALATGDEEIYERVKRLRNNGSTSKYVHDEIGFNMRMGSLEAAVLLVKLKYLEKWNDARIKIASKYRQHIDNPLIQLQKQDSNRQSVYHLMVITAQNREALLKHLNANSIFPGMHYPIPCHLQKAFKDYGHKKGDFPNAEFLAEHCLSLPMYPELSEEETDRVIEAINNFK